MPRTAKGRASASLDAANTIIDSAGKAALMEHCWHMLELPKMFRSYGDSQEVCCYCGTTRRRRTFLDRNTPHGPHCPEDGCIAFHASRDAYFVYSDQDVNQRFCHARTSGQNTVLHHEEGDQS